MLILLYQTDIMKNFPLFFVFLFVSFAMQAQEFQGLQETIIELNNRIEQDALNNNQKVIAFSRIVKDAKIRYKAIESLGFAKVLSSKDFIKIDTIPVVTVQWDAKLQDSTVLVNERELRNWLQIELNLDTLFIKREK